MQDKTDDRISLQYRKSVEEFEILDCFPSLTHISPSTSFNLNALALLSMTLCFLSANTIQSIVNCLLSPRNYRENSDDHKIGERL
jgi:hypothetical protein